MIFSFSKRNYFPERWNVTAEAANDPLQNPTIQLPFKIKKGENEFFIEPLYDYKITGIVVSYRQHDLENGLHKKWGEKGDNLNISDICVVWGSNIKSELLNHIDFYNGDYTCFFETKSQSVFDSFKQDQLSNNHLLSADQRIIKKINQIKRGDQIQIEGLLANYGDKNGIIRKSSVTRKDTDNGACETLYVTDFKIINHTQYPFSLWKASWMGALLTIVTWFIAVGVGIL